MDSEAPSQPVGSEKPEHYVAPSLLRQRRGSCVGQADRSDISAPGPKGAGAETYFYNCKWGAAELTVIERIVASKRLSLKTPGTQCFVPVFSEWRWRQESR
jgi:hypothetical protein